jgi:hypothetical protein
VLGSGEVVPLALLNSFFLAIARTGAIRCPFAPDSRARVFGGPADLLTHQVNITG